MYEAAKQHIAATDAQLGVPEMSTQAQQNIAAFQHQQDGLNAQWAGEAWQMQQRQAAAAAAAQRAAEDKAWQRQMDLAKLGQEADKLAIEQMKAMGMSGEDIQKQAQHLGDKLADPKLAEGRAAVEAAKMRLLSVAPDEGLPGVGRGADLREKLAGPATDALSTGRQVLLPGASFIAKKTIGLSPEERVSRSDWEKIKLAYQHQITGSGASEHEREMINAAFEGAKTPAEQRSAITNADAMFKQVESRQKAAVDPRALQLYENRVNAQAGIMPSSVRVKTDGNLSDERAKQFKKKLAGGY